MTEMTISVIRKAHVPSVPRRSKQNTCFVQEQGTYNRKQNKKLLRSWSELIFLSSGWSNSECERRGRHCDLQTYCHSDWCLDREIKQAELHLYSKEQRQVPWSFSSAETPNAKWLDPSPVPLLTPCRIRCGGCVCIADQLSAYSRPPLRMQQVHRG